MVNVAILLPKYGFGQVDHQVYAEQASIIKDVLPQDMSVRIFDGATCLEDAIRFLSGEGFLVFLSRGEFEDASISKRKNSGLRVILFTALTDDLPRDIGVELVDKSRMDVEGILGAFR